MVEDVDIAPEASLGTFCHTELPQDIVQAIKTNVPEGEQAGLTARLTVAYERPLPLEARELLTSSTQTNARRTGLALGGFAASVGFAELYSRLGLVPLTVSAIRETAASIRQLELTQQALVISGLIGMNVLGAASILGGKKLGEGLFPKIGKWLVDQVNLPEREKNLRAFLKSEGIISGNSLT